MFYSKQIWLSVIKNIDSETFFFIHRFQAALKKYGVPEEEIFQTADLFERRNIPQVTLCLYALGRLVCYNHENV